MPNPRPSLRNQRSSARAAGIQARRPSCQGRSLIIILVVSVVLAVATWMWFRPSGDPLLNRIPHAYLPEDVFTNDPAELILWRGAPQGPHVLTLADGRQAWPAYHFPEGSDPTLIFPLIITERGRTTVGLPPSGRKPTDDQLLNAAPWLSAEAQALYAAFAERNP